VKLYRFERSTNVERVALALAFKGLGVDSVWVDPRDRTPVREVSGQGLVPVLVDGEQVVFDSLEIIRYLERTHPEPSLFPADPAEHAVLQTFLEWFDGVWKGPPNEIERERARPSPDGAAIERLGLRLEGWLDRFDDMLTGRDYLFGDELTAADCAAFPFLKYALLGVERGDDEDFHRVLAEYQPLDGTHSRLEAWIRRVDERPRA